MMTPSARRKVLALALVAAGFLARRGLAQPAQMVKDLRTTSSTPLLPSPALWTAQLGGSTYFAFDDGLHGSELWKTDGTPAGTALVVDVCPGICGGLSGSEIVVSGSSLFFRGDDGAHGAELWVSDGTAAGTHLLADLVPGLRLRWAGPAWLTDVGGTLFFVAAEPSGNRSLWKTDGTSLGTQLVKSFPVDSADPVYGGLTQLLAFGSTLFFAANDGIHGYEPWISDGTPAGTQMIADLNPGPTDAMFGGFTPFPARQFDPVVFGGRVYFAASVAAAQGELWRTSGLPGDAELVLGDVPGGSSSWPQFLRVFGAQLYFTRFDSNGNQLWVYDGASAPIPIALGSASLPYGLTVAGSHLFFIATTAAEGAELWATDGGPPALVKDIRPGPDSAFLGFPWVYVFGPVGSNFFAWANDAPNVASPWTSDGTSVGTQRIVTADPGTQSSSGWASAPFPVGSKNAFIAYRFVSLDDYSLQLWGTDGTPGGTALIADLPSPSSSNFESFGLRRETLAGGPTSLAFQPSLSLPSFSLWTSDGTEPGTGPVLGTGLQISYALIQWQNKIVVSRDDGIHGDEPWVFDGVNATMLADTNPAGDGSPYGYLATGSFVYFNSSGGLWSTDGSPSGTQVVDPIGGYSLIPIAGGVSYLQSGSGSCSLRRSDGTPAGTSTLVSAAGTCSLLAGDGSRAFFSLNDGQLWVSDGTSLGTTPVVDLAPGRIVLTAVPGFTNAQVFQVVHGRAFFVVSDTTSGEELWTSDGTSGGTHIVKDIFPGPQSCEPQWLTAAGTGIFFVADDGTHGRELWWSDGSDAGTHLVKDIVPGAGSSVPDQLAYVDSVLMFAAHDSTAGREMWASNGSDGGTVRLQDINPGAEPSSPMSFTVAGENVFFYANDGVHGFELWALPRAALADAVSASLAYFSVNPCRLLDTRAGGGPLASGAELQVTVSGNCGIPASAKSVALNVTVVGASNPGDVTLGAANLAIPATNVVSFRAGQARASQAVLRLATSGSGKLKARANLIGGGTVHLVLDVAGWFE